MEGSPFVEPSDRAASLEPVEFSGLSTSMPPPLALPLPTLSAPALLLCLRWRFDDMVIERGSDAAPAPGPGVFLGGAAAIGTTPFPPTAPPDDPALKLVGVLPAVLPPDAPPTLAGLSPSLALPARVVADGGVVACATLTGVDMASVEFLRVAVPALPEPPPAFFLAARVLVPPTGKVAPDPRFRFLMTSVFKLSGLTTPWSFRNRPHALQSGWPSGFRRHSGVVWVKQLVQVVGVFPSPWFPPAPCRFVVEPCFDPGGDDGRLGVTDENPESVPAASAGGEFGVDCASRSNGFPFLMCAAGVDAVLGTFPRLSAPLLPDRNDCDCDRPRLPPSQSPAVST
jgi:hypothetical protein